ncbi:MAG: molybdopterin-dependent oxidoreductase [Chloroflexi bacterium]|nr:molybdopterin-dependent oxidoreductase [Chloroflexota bacterium]
MQTQKLPGWGSGALVGALLTISLVAISFLGHQAVGLPFVGFDFFDWLGRTLDGRVVTFGIDMIVGVIRSLNLGPTATTAKLAEQIMGVGAIIGLGAGAGVLFFALAPRVKTLRQDILGIGLGIAAGALMLLISLSLNRPSTLSPLVIIVWTLLLFTAWGLAHGWVYRDMTNAGTIVHSDGKVEVEVLDRRQFLIRLGGATATITAIGAGLGGLLGQRAASSVPVNTVAGEAQTPGAGDRWSAANALPNADAEIEAAPGTRPELSSLEDHYRIDINSVPPVVDGTTWTLPITGLVETPLNLTMADIQAYEPLHRFVTLSCISNGIGGDLISTQRWTGASLKRVLEAARPTEDAAYLRISGADGFFEYVSLEMINADERIMLTYYWDGVPLEIEHGYPLRIYIPDLYGMKQPKWITSIEVVDAWDEGFWVVRGWDEVARVNTTSVIDAVAANSSYERDGTTYVPIGGIAYAGARSISRVEVRVNDGEWQEARLRTPLSDTTWVIWRYDWAFASGEHTFEVRAVDGDGAAQREESRPVRPSGATGVHRVRRTL